ncbi:MAG: ribose 5-phosphate isomerase B [Planctomycetes bacterium]|nr:ribose 5-phosphate isomerase B [Planctomycetota bacterium]
MKIALGSDHRGCDVVARLTEHLESRGHDAGVLGPCDGSSCDYPDGAFAVATAVARGDWDRGVLVCGSGIGMSMAANKVDGIRAALAVDTTAAEMTRRHNDANVLCLAADRLTPDEACAIVDAFLDADFEGGRHARRVEKITAIEAGRLKSREAPC